MEKVVTQCGYDRIVIYGNNLQFTTKCYIPRDAMLSAVYAVVVCRSVCMHSVCVCVSVTVRYCIKTAKHRITHIMPHDRVFK